MAVFQAFDHVTANEDLEAIRELAAEAQYATESWDAVEVGTWMGGTALVLERHFKRVFCVDTWEGNPGDRLGPIASASSPGRLLDAFCANMGSKLFASVFPVPGTSQGWARRWGHRVAMVFIDANHDYDQVRADILAWSPHVLPGGILCGHDYSTFEGVTRAVDELIPADELGVKGTTWWTYAR